MIAHSILLVCVLFARTCNASSNMHFSFLRSSSEIPPHLGPNTKPKPDRDPTHISDFTDPDTGLNPFLDLPEGRTGAFGRRVMEQDRPAPLLPEMNVDVIEGGPDDRGRPRMPPSGIPRLKPGRDPMGRNDFQKHTTPKKSPETQRSYLDPVPDYSRKTFDFSAFTEANPFPVTEETPLQVGEESPVTLRTTIDDVKHRASDDVEHVTSKPENPFLATDVTVSALVTGAGVAALALVVMVVCWKRRTTTTPTRPQPRDDVERAERSNSLEAANDKQNGGFDSCFRK